MSRYKPNEEVEIVVERREADFDRACDTVMSAAILKFGSKQEDEYGCYLYVEGAHRSNSSIEIRFDSYHMSDDCVSGWTHYYRFMAKVVIHEDE